MRAYYSLGGMEGFTCLKQNCDYTCCKDLSIAVDKHAYRAYKNCTDMTLRPLFNRFLSRERGDAQAGDAAYGRIKLDNGVCPFLEDGACAIWNRMGEEHVCGNCRLFPYQINRFGDRHEALVNLSCIEAARVFLNADAPLSFVETDGGAYLNAPATNDLDPGHAQFAQSPLKLYFDMRALIVEALKYDRYTLVERMAFVGSFTHRLHENFFVEDTERMIAMYGELLHDPIFVKESVIDEDRGRWAFAFATQTLLLRTQLGGLSGQLKDALNAAMGNLGIVSTANVDTDAAYDCFIDAVNRLEPSMLSAFNAMAERFLINEVYRGLFPFNERDVWASFMVLAVSLCCAYYLAVAMSITEPGTAHLPLCFSAVTRSITSSRAMLDSLLGNIKSAEFDNTLQMSALLRLCDGIGGDGA